MLPLMSSKFQIMTMVEARVIQALVIQARVIQAQVQAPLLVLLLR